MSEVRGADSNESRECSDALDAEGYVLGMPDANGIVAKCAADAQVYGVAQKSTKHPITGTAEADKEVGVLRAPKFAMVQYNNGVGETISVGSLLSMKGANAAGCCREHSWTTWAAGTGTERKTLVGIALEAKAQSTSGLVKCILLCPSFPMQ
ncbi:MAG: hypothetical protein AM326_03055 [Candidatus Thorarchaeota archaeon SMTZ-45]|nr:MAG: hypothetical protein AM326_03055 [Candidatus Thorarchaeota archaeon SMTZ-45]